MKHSEDTGSPRDDSKITEEDSECTWSQLFYYRKISYSHSNYINEK